MPKGKCVAHSSGKVRGKCHRERVNAELRRLTKAKRGRPPKEFCGDATEIMAAVERVGVSAVARYLKVSRTTLYRWIKRQRRDGL